MKKNILLLTLLTSVGMSVQAQQNEIEVMCKSKAKEIAANTYKDCISENKQAEIQRIRTEYQTQLSDLKSKYNSQLEKLSSSKAKSKIKPSSELTSISKDSDSLASEKVKKMNPAVVKSERIDLTESITAPATEIIEIPIQSE